MKKVFSYFFALVLSINLFANTNPVGQKANYVLNGSSDRSSWVIKGGKAEAIIKGYDTTSPYGPGYILEINYDMSVRFKGRQQGTIGLLVPEPLFAENFINELIAEHPRSFGAFDLDYLGQTGAKDADDHYYNPCYKLHIYNIDSNYRPRNGVSRVGVLYIKGDRIEDLEVNMKAYPGLAVLGAIQLDVSGVSSGISFKAGFDLKP